MPDYGCGLRRRPWSPAPEQWQGGRVEATEFILYVADQAKATAFYRHVLAAEPVLDVPGMTEFNLGGATLGLMPAADMEDLLAGQIRGGTGQRCELYLRRTDAAAHWPVQLPTVASCSMACGTGRGASALATRWTRTATSWPSRYPPGQLANSADRLVLTGMHRQAACRLPRPKTGYARPGLRNVRTNDSPIAMPLCVKWFVRSFSWRVSWPFSAGQLGVVGW